MSLEQIKAVLLRIFMLEIEIVNALDEYNYTYRRNLQIRLSGLIKLLELHHITIGSDEGITTVFQDGKLLLSFDRQQLKPERLIWTMEDTKSV